MHNLRNGLRADLLERTIRNYEQRLAEAADDVNMTALWYFDWDAFETYLTYAVEHFRTQRPSELHFIKGPWANLVIRVRDDILEITQPQITGHYKPSTDNTFTWVESESS